MRASVTLAADGTIYACSSYDTGATPSNLYAVRPDGTIKWKFPTGKRELENAPVVASDGTIYVGSADSIMYAVNPDGTQKWKFKANSPIFQTSGVLGLDGRLYFVSINGMLYALNPDGSESWHLTQNPVFSGTVISEIAMSPTGRSLYLAGRSHSFYSVTVDGAVEWMKTLSGQVDGGPIVMSDGTIIVFTTPDVADFTTITALSPDGAVLWTVHDDAVSGFNDPTVDKEGALYYIAAVGLQYYLYCRDSNGQLVWRKPVNADVIEVSLVCDSTRTVFFFPSEGSIAYAIASDGSVVWTLPWNGDDAICCPALDGVSSMYVPCNSGFTPTPGRALYRIN